MVSKTLLILWLDQSMINLDFADVEPIMSSSGKAMMGTGEAEGDNRAMAATELALNYLIH